ncbi:hypothetical protein [Flavobacterium sp.]|uniref:hypothetical protein n=1 Tax=Flavobacterium sp. TaxID=239 RepID=UPI00261C05F3|nr:hypothetical protein [Flavobacterium sp.]MDG2431506.1 hypothetical protein [Flavobacterium sp.]
MHSIGYYLIIDVVRLRLTGVVGSLDRNSSKIKLLTIDFGISSFIAQIAALNLLRSPLGTI